MTKQYKIIVAGCGVMAQTWVDYTLTRDDAEIVGVVDIMPEAAQAFVEKKQLSCPIFDDIGKAIEATGANLVFDITIPASHYAIASTAMKLGCDVFSEKPLAENMQQCIALVQQAQQLGRTHAIMQNRRYDPRIRSLRQLVSNGEIGKVGFTGADYFMGPHFGGFREAMESPLLLDMAIHTFDQARLILGSNPVSVFCEEFNPEGSWYDGNAMAICTYEMSDGSVFNYRGSWCAEGARTSWEGTWRIVGSKGTAIWDGRANPYAEVVSSDDQEGKLLYDVERIDGQVIEMEHTFHPGCLDAMFEALVEGRQPETASSDNIYSMAMVLAALESSRTGKRVNIGEFMDRAE